MSILEYEKVLNFVDEEDVKFIRLAFFDVFGVQKNISIMSDELERAFRDGISFDASAVAGFGDEVDSDLFLCPDPSTLVILPWRPANGRVARMYCDITYPDGRLFEKDSRYILKEALEKAKEKGFSLDFGPEIEFYLFHTDEDGNSTKIPYDHAGYMDIAPEDRGENVRREICLNLLEMGMQPEASHHEEGPGQNEIDFRYANALTAADYTSAVKWVIKAAAMGNGLYADFSPKPIANQPGNGMHINMSVHNEDGKDYTDLFLSGVMAHIKEITLFLNPDTQSYKRLGEKKAPKYITWSPQNRSQLIRIPASRNGQRRIELRSPDTMANPYLAFALLIYAGLDGIEKNMPLPEPVNMNLFTATKEVTDHLSTIPLSIEEAIGWAKDSKFISDILPEVYIEAYKNKINTSI